MGVLFESETIKTLEFMDYWPPRENRGLMVKYSISRKSFIDTTNSSDEKIKQINA